MANFNEASKKVLIDEGVYSDDKDDVGGKTKYGITEQVARKHGYTGEMINMSLDWANMIYKIDYWDILKLDLVKDQTLAEVLYQFGVNCGVGTACKSLQRTLNILNRGSLSWFDILTDGIIGKKTLEIINSLSDEDILYTSKIVLGLQFERYISICERKASQETFIRGWVNRIGHYLKGLFK